MGFIAGSIVSAANPQAPSDGFSDSRAMPMQRIVESIMRGNGEVQAQAQAKDVAGKQMDATKKMSVTMTANPDDPGNPLLHIKNATADIVNQTQSSDLQQTYDAPKKNVEEAIAKMNAPTQSVGQFEGDALRSVGYAPERTDRTAADLQSYGQDYRAQRDLGEPVIKAAIKAAIMRTGVWNKDKIAETLDRNAAAQNAAAFKAVAEPVLQEQDRERSSGIAMRTMLTKEDADRRGALAQYLKPGALASLGDDPMDVLTQVHNSIPGGLTPREQRGTLNAITKDYVFADKTALDEGNKIVKSIDPTSVISGQTWAAKEAELRSEVLPYGRKLSEPQIAIAKDRFERSQQRVAGMDAMQKASLARQAEGLQLERLRIQKDTEAMRQQAEMAKLNTPEAVAQSVNAVMADGNQLYNLPTSTPVEKAFKAKVEFGVRAATGGRLPQQIKPGSEDDKRIVVISQGIADTNKIEELYDKWLPVAPLGGPATEALNRAIIANKPSAYLANLAMQVVPGFSRLSSAKKDEYLSDAANMAHRVNALSIREARSTTGGGRMAAQIVDMFHGITPGFQNPATFKGLVTGARQEFANAENAIRSKQWSGQPPSVQAGSTATPSGPVVTDPNAIMNMFKKKP